VRELGEGTGQVNEDMCACKNIIYIGPLLAFCPIHGRRSKCVQGCRVCARNVWVAVGVLILKNAGARRSPCEGRLAFGVCVVGRMLCLSKEKWRGTRTSVLSSQARRVGLGDGRDDYHNAQVGGSRPPQRDHTSSCNTHFDGVHVLFLCCMQFSRNSMGKRQMASPPKAKQNTTRRYKAM